MRTTDVADTEQLFRLIQSVPLQKAERLSFDYPKLDAKGLIKLKILIWVSTA